MSCNYVVTAYKATAVSNSLTGNFTGPSDLNLIESKGNNLVVNLVTPEGLKPLVDVSINGRITIMQLFRLKVSVILCRVVLKYRHSLF
jgi:DNA damage-binding protein 1